MPDLAFCVGEFLAGDALRRADLAGAKQAQRVVFEHHRCGKGLLNAVADNDRTVAAKHHGLVLPERAGEGLALLGALYQRRIGVDGYRFAKGRAGDADRVQRFANNAEQRGVGEVQVEYRHHIGARLEHTGEDRRFAWRIVAALDLVALRIDHNKIIALQQPGMAALGAAHLAWIEQQVAGLRNTGADQAAVVHQAFHVEQPAGIGQFVAQFLASLHGFSLFGRCGVQSMVAPTSLTTLPYLS